MIYYVVFCYNGFEIVNSNSIWLCYPTENLHVSCIKFVANYNALNRFIHSMCTGCICNAWTDFKSQFFESKRSIKVCPELFLYITNLTHSSFHICLFRYYTCFEQPFAHHQENQLYQYDIWHMSLYVGDRLVRRYGWIHTCIPDGHRVTYNRCRTDTIYSPDDEHTVARNMYSIEINIYRKNCASRWLFTGIILRGTVNKT